MSETLTVKSLAETLTADKNKNGSIRFVFDKQFFSTAEGLYCYQCKDDMFLKRVRLAELEKDFALKCGLIGEDSTGDNALSE